ncbi:hypothetical protein [Streptomyces sp. NPDC091209]|uniref:hypothetical protein n=1 Tax=Streptomyces sp. NPDC091209 TaxID=3365974 RepID=UPI00381CB563
MGVGISPERGERAERAAGGRPERTPEPETELLVGRATETDAFPARGSDAFPGRRSDTFSGRWPEASSPSERESGAWFGAERSVKAAAPAARTTETRPYFNDAPETELLPGSTPDLAPSVPPSWEHTDGPAKGHDPHEVTIQLDSAGPRLEDWLVQQAKDAPANPETSDGPVFVDASGRRSRRYRRLGMLVAVACAVYAVVIVATLLSGNSNAPWLPVPGQEEDQPAGRVDTSPLPTQSVNPSGTGGAIAPGAVATAADGTTPSSGSTFRPGASATASAPGASSDPKPSASATKKPNPGVVTKNPDPDPKPSSSTVSQPPASPTATTSSAPTPTESTGPGGATGVGAGTQ